MFKSIRKQESQWIHWGQEYEEVSYNEENRNIKLPFFKFSKERIKNGNNGILFINQINKDENIIILNVSDDMINHILAYTNDKG